LFYSGLIFQGEFHAAFVYSSEFFYEENILPYLFCMESV